TVGRRELWVLSSARCWRRREWRSCPSSSYGRSASGGSSPPTPARRCPGDRNSRLSSLKQRRTSADNSRVAAAFPFDDLAAPLGSGAVRVLVVLPTYQEAANIVEVLRRVRASLPGADVLVVDDS